MALQVGGTNYEHREVLLSNKPAAMLAASPKGTVPVLVSSTGNVVDESVDIMRWALTQNDPEDWMSRLDTALVETFDGAFKHHLDRYKYAANYDCDPLVPFAQGLAMLTALDQRLAEHRYLGGVSRGFDDIALFPFVRQFAAVDASRFATRASPRVCKWLGSLVSSELFQLAMTKFALWSDEPQRRSLIGKTAQ